jgi:glycosyltransferase involved in cell wall biosynthesis
VPATALFHWLATALLHRSQDSAALAVESALRSRILREGFRGANALYTLSNGDLDLVREAKARGMLVVHEHIINPHVGRVLREERSRYPGLEEQDSQEVVEGGIERDVAQWQLADLILVASRFVADEILEHQVPSDRIEIVPYGIPESWLGARPNPVPGRVLFVGTVGLRKGVHYLAAASRLLRDRGVRHEVRVVGPFDPRVVQRPEFAGPTYVGQIPRSVVRREFEQADVFVLPTLSESFALVHLEALACGVPVITTPNCGSTVQDGIEGFIVPIRDPETLANRIERVLADRGLRERLSLAAVERAREFTWECYSKRLLAAIQRAMDRTRAC